MTRFVVVIPARYASTRLPGKALRKIHDKPMLQYVFECGSASRATEVVVATDDDRIADTAADFGATVCMTGNQHRSGTERIAEVVDLLDWDDEQIVVNLQGDEPAMPAALIDQCADLLADATADIATLASPMLAPEDIEDPNIVKVVRDINDHAIYFSRAAIPFARDEGSQSLAVATALHHHGIYAYRCGVLRRLVAAEPSKLEVCEQLEQLRALSLGMTIAVGVPPTRPGTGIDTEADLEKAKRELQP
ncbi:MAG: 3-deoxy-manno-octulosonate cytidylyltransferase [Woeseiaceae bacterium]